MSAISATVQALIAGAATSAIAGDRITPIIAPEHEAYPNVVVNLVSDTDVPDITGPSGFAVARVSVAARGMTASDVIRLGDAIKTDLHRRSGVFAGCRAQFLTEGTDVTGYIPNASVKERSIDFYVWWRKAA